MTPTDLTSLILALPAEQRAALAQAVWESLEDAEIRVSADIERDALANAQRRDAELSSGAALGRDHADVLRDARRALQ